MMEVERLAVAAEDWKVIMKDESIERGMGMVERRGRSGSSKWSGGGGGGLPDGGGGGSGVADSDEGGGSEDG